VFFIGNDTGWVVGGDFGTERIFKTTNAGDNWTVQTSGTPNKLFSVYFVNTNTGWSVGGPSAPKIIKTTDGGSTWLAQTTSAGTPLYSVRFADANTGWAVAGYIGGETIIKTTNGGATWFSQSSGDNRYLRACAVINSNIAFAVGQSGKMITTTNGGTNWQVQSTGSSIELWSIDFVNDTVGYAIGDNVVLKTTNQGLTFVNSNGTEIPDKFVLHQNYPNPFNPVTTIEFEIPVKSQTSNMKLSVYDIEGKKIAVLYENTTSQEHKSVTWDASKYPSGIYYYSLSADNVILDSKKMILIK
jgi:photosystem II stability/assembly factor-like uncharacterized protein